MVSLYCHSGREYLLLPQNGELANFATAGDTRPYYCALRFDPRTLLVDVADMTFTYTTESGSNWAAIAEMPYGATAGCPDLENYVAANINLDNTPFKVSDSMRWYAWGHLTQWNATIFSPDR